MDVTSRNLGRFVGQVERSDQKVMASATKQTNKNGEHKPEGVVRGRTNFDDFPSQTPFSSVSNIQDVLEGVSAAHQS